MGRVGSSPLARGLPIWDGSRAKVSGIIPARAGFTSITCASAASTTDHPRSRGVYSERLQPVWTGGGSSPLARGLPPEVLAHIRNRGIIPARAGFTFASAAAWLTSQDHPRSRGVYGKVVCSPSHFGGSSPLARGLPDIDKGTPRVRGIIPARAGFTVREWVGTLVLMDHPRSRGVYPDVPFLCPTSGRIIPARAGFT